jgi:hypothetical protein
MMGTLNEGALHAGLREWYRRPGDRLEQDVDGTWSISFAATC